MANTLLSCADALALVAAKMQTLHAPPLHTLPLDAANGRVLAQSLHADRDQPPFARSTRDGYAVRALDVAGTIEIVGTIRAGEAWAGPALQPGQGIEIMTGAPVPVGVDAVVMLEHVTLLGSSLTLQPGRTFTHGENIVPRGAEVGEGHIVLQQGTRMGAAEIALAASIGAAHVAVYAQPAVTILATGDELVTLDAVPGPMQIRNSNSHGLAAMVAAHGGVAQLLPPAADTREALHAAIASARNCAMLLLSGGVSAGKYDFVEDVLLGMGAEFFFTGVAMQPGKPAVFGRIPPQSDHAEQWVFGLPGNPVSTQVTALLFAMPLLRALGGEAAAAPTFAQATLTEDVRIKRGLTRFLPARIQSSLAGANVRPTGWQGSGDLQSNARANCYLVIPPDVETLAAGSAATVLLR